MPGNPALRRQLLMRGAAGSGAGFSGVNFDGSTYLGAVAGGVTGLTDGTAFTLGFKIKTAALSGRLFDLNAAKVAIDINGDGSITITAKDSGGGTVLLATSGAAALVVGSIATILIAYNAGTYLCYINDVAQPAATTHTAGTIDFTGAGANGFFSSYQGSGVYAGVSYFLYFARTNLDISVQSNRDKFATAIAMLTDGSGPTGAQPLIYYTGNAAAWASNKGSGGNFTMTGAVTDL